MLKVLIILPYFIFIGYNGGLWCIKTCLENVVLWNETTALISYPKYNKIVFLD